MKLVIDVGGVPIAHQFASSMKESMERELFPMRLMTCQECGLGQLDETIAPEVLYSGYNFCFSAWKAQPQTQDECQIIRQYMPSGTVLEVGSNDGMFLSEIKEYGDYDCIGIEPNKVACAQARGKGLTVINRFFEDALNHELAESSVQVVVARQVLEHIQDVALFLKSANKLLDIGGLICIEVPNTDIALTTGDVSCLWEEHVNYFTPDSLRNALESFGFEIVVEKTYLFSGEAIMMVGRKIADCVKMRPAKAVNLDKFNDYSAKVDCYRTDLKQLITIAKSNEFSVALYGSGCRASVAIHALDLVEEVDLIVDDQEEKQGMYMPRTTLPVSSSSALLNNSRVLILLAVNNENEDKVLRRIDMMGIVDYFTLSLHSPRDIQREIISAKKYFENVSQIC